VSQITNHKSRTTVFGFSLIEIIVVLGVLGIVGVVTANALVSTLRGSRKVDSQSRVKQNLDYTISIMDRHLRSARSVDCASSTRVNYIDQTFSGGSFFLGSTASLVGFVASGSGSIRLTGPEVNITSVSFSCTAPSGNRPASVTISITGTDVVNTGVEGASATASTVVYLRSNL
jgi:prepilin-type N-terminal cleavage/methylation domain-containing protein